MQVQKWLCLFSFHAHATYGGVPVWAEPFEICYFTCIFKDLKSFDMQTIYAIPGEISEIKTMAR